MIERNVRPTVIMKHNVSYPIPVSYTHLDVYKRQSQHYQLGEKGYAYADVRLNTPDGERADAAVGDGPVDASLKAVDVYKRQILLCGTE